MSITQQHMLDAYRAALHGEPMPPAPGTAAASLRRAVARPGTDGREDGRSAVRRSRGAALLRAWRAAFVRAPRPRTHPDACR
ncbi:hypothetical protein [Streptomyces sp. XD-27]|uniref:hypothetical protein n=1 Tax=Streptomyces sp. XD-27 TaxID=3062779 RepID=UPI0026F41CB7|nr:hypothetical protein [Streptomyces sp. XD-27]WKX71802.1 hypothetical protein Q3Y56_19555 [Streptomyces sp. XD-27]